MNTTMVMNGILFMLFLITCICIPVSAYSADATNLYSSARNLTESGNYTEAVAAYNHAITLEPMYFEAWNGLADALNREGQFNEALAASNRSLEINPDYVKGWINRGQILYSIGYQYEDVAHDLVTANVLYAEQLAAFEKAIALDHNNAEAWFNEGYALAGMQRFDEAIAAFDRVKDIDPSYPNLQKNREIAVQLRNKAATPSQTTVPVYQTIILKTTTPAGTQETSAQWPTGTTTQPSPLNGAAGIIAITGAAFLILQRR